MGQVLHGSATTTEAIRRAIQHSQESLRALAKRYGIVVGQLTDSKDPNQGFDAQNETYVDPAKVVRTALQDAGSIAALLITAEAMITDIPAKDAAPSGGGGGMGN